MSAWAHSVDPSAWRYDQVSQATQPMQQTYVPQPSTSNGGQSINNSFDQWGSTSDYGLQGNSMGYVQAVYGGQGGGDNDYRVMNGPASSNHLHHPPSNSQLSHQSYAPSSYPSAQQQLYPSTSRAPYQPPASQSHVEPPNSFRFGQHSEELPTTSQAAVSLSATAQRFQNAPSTGPPSHTPSPRFSQPISQTSNIPIEQQPDPHSRPIPSPTSIQQFHRKVDELAMLQHRLTQLEGILKRGTMAETGPGASQPIPSHQKAHLDIQVKEFKYVLKSRVVIFKEKGGRELKHLLFSHDSQKSTGQLDERVRRFHEPFRARVNLERRSSSSSRSESKSDRCKRTAISTSE